MRARLLVSDDMTVETGVDDAGLGWLRLAYRDHGVRVDSLDPAVWGRLAHAAAALERDHQAALSPPPHRAMVP